ncbi:MAG: hypothetical protein FD133_1229 [Erysipelotrichaceae bacterium]|nr:MAG: hypothetical protein FD133_1229 [Erysipelotrichaceae bacterium]
MVFLAEISQIYTRQTDQKALETSWMDQDHWVVPATTGSSMGLDHVFAIKNIKSSQRLISFGSSMTLAGIIDENFQWDHINASTGSMSIQTLFVMKSYLSQLGISYADQDVIKLDLSPVMFTKKSLNLEVLVSALQFQGIYTVTEDLTVKKNNLGFIGSFYGIKSKAIEKALYYFTTSLRNGNLESIYESHPITFDQYEKFLDFSLNNTALLEIFIESFANENLVIDLMFMHPDLQKSKTGLEFNAYVDTILIPYLNVLGIAYLDHRSLYLSNDYADSTHLNGKARLKYTALIQDELRSLGYE